MESPSGSEVNNNVISFRDRGFVHIKQFFDQKVCADAVNAINTLEQNLSPSNSVNIVTETIQGKVFAKYYQGIYSESTALRSFFSLELLQLASQLLGTTRIYYSDIEAHLRNPGGGQIPKHQDNFYFNLKDARGLTVYVALTPHDKHSGGLNYLARSHASVVNHNLSSCPGFSSYITEQSLDGHHKSGKEVFSPSYEVGDISIHHPNNIHWSNPSPQTAPRGYALSLRVFSLDEQIDPSGRERYLKLLSQNRTK